MKEAVTRIIQSFEKGSTALEETKKKIEEITGREVDEDHLQNYWRSMDLNEYVDILTEPVIENWQSLDDDSTLSIIREVREESCNQGRQLQIFEALEKRYRKSDVMDLFFFEELNDEEILEELKKDTVIRI